MTNLLHLVVSIVDDPEARQTFRDDPNRAVGGVDDLTGEDVAAVVDVARAQVAPESAEAMLASLDLRLRGEETPRDVAIRSLLAICDAAD